MMYRSFVEKRGLVTFPEYRAERVYMRPFTKKDGLSSDLSRWQHTVDQMLDGVETDGPVYLMIDQGLVPSRTSHRRPGVHIDGYWQPEVKAHRGGGGRHIPREPVHGPRRAPGHSGGGTHGGWCDASFREPEGLILASSLTAARAFNGAFSGPIGDMGNCEHIDVSRLAPVVPESGSVYAGNVTCLHESLPVEEDCLRTLVRLNVPGWTPEARHAL